MKTRLTAFFVFAMALFIAFTRSGYSAEAQFPGEKIVHEGIIGYLPEGWDCLTAGESLIFRSRHTDEYIRVSRVVMPFVGETIYEHAEAYVKENGGSNPHRFEGALDFTAKTGENAMLVPFGDGYIALLFVYRGGMSNEFHDAFDSIRPQGPND